jgi:hypothetical protein
LANVDKRIPPASLVSPLRGVIFIPKQWPIEIKHMEKGIIIENVD